MEKFIIKVNGMSCSHCEDKVKKAILALNGIKSVKASSKKGEVICKGEKGIITLDVITSTISNLGYEVI